MLPGPGYTIVNNNLTKPLDMLWVTRTQTMSSGTRCYIRGGHRVRGEESRRIFRMFPAEGENGSRCLKDKWGLAKQRGKGGSTGSESRDKGMGVSRKHGVDRQQLGMKCKEEMEVGHRAP